MYGELPTFKYIDRHTAEQVEGPAYPVVIESSPIGPKTAALRLPTSDEMKEYLQVQRTNYRNLGRRKGQDESVPNPKASRKLFDAIRLDGGADFDDAEVERALNLITRLTVVDCAKTGNGYDITLSTPFGKVIHGIRSPYESEKAEYVRSFMKEIDLPHDVTERRFPPDAYTNLYDKIAQTVEGYKDSKLVPVHHKRSVIFELMVTLQSLDPDLDPNS